MSSKTSLMTLALVAILSALVPVRASAQTAEERELASALFRESADAYRVGNLELAVTLLRRAYELNPAPVLQYNLGRALEGMGDTDGAIAAYEQYLELDPDADDRGAIEEKLAELRAEQAEAEAEAAAEADEFLEGPALEPEAPEGPMPPPPHVSPIPWAIAGVGVLLLGGAALTGALANARHDDALATMVHAERVQLADEADTLARITNLNLVLGAVFLLAGGTWGVIDLLQVRGERELSLRIGPGQLALRGQF